MNFDDGSLKRKTLIAVATIGGGCALFLTLAGGASWMVSRATSSPSSPASTTVSTDDSESSKPAAGTPRTSPGRAAPKTDKTEI